MAKKIKILIVDDSEFIRQVFKDIFSSDPDIEVVGEAEDPYDAREKIKHLNPDVVTLDVEMPKMDGITFLEKLMKLRPLPVVMASTLTQKGATTTIKALEIGAIDYVAKPMGTITEDNLKLLSNKLIEKVKLASTVKIEKKISNISNKKILGIKSDKVFSKDIIAIGSSTGGVETLREILTTLPKGLPPIVIVQHMPDKFTKSFADRLNNICEVNIQEASNEQILQKGNVYIAQGNKHLKIDKKSGQYVGKVYSGENVSGHCPSVDVLFSSLASAAKNKAVGLILTGMGSDGAEGLLKMKNAGAITFGQSEKTCVIYGMPKAAKNIGAFSKDVDLDKIPQEIINNCYL